MLVDCRKHDDDDVPLNNWFFFKLGNFTNYNFLILVTAFLTPNEQYFNYIMARTTPLH